MVGKFWYKMIQNEAYDPTGFIKTEHDSSALGDFLNRYSQREQFKKI